MGTRQEFRTVERGDVALDVNSKSMTSDCFVDRSRLQSRYTEEYVPSSKPGKPGQYVPKMEVASLQDNARQGCDAMKHRSSYRDESVPANDNPGDCYPSFYGGQGPLTRKRGDN